MAIHMRGKTPSDIERETGVSKSYISRVINNKILNPKKFIKMLSEHLGISETWLVDGVGSIDSPSENNIRVFDIIKNKTTNSIVVYDNEKSISSSNLLGWKGFTHSPYNENSIVVTTGDFNNTDGEYVLRKDNEFFIAMRVNCVYESKWLMKKTLEKIVNIYDYEVIGMIIFTIVSGNIRKIEIT
ncbi:hypothetical protein VII00023_20662 [Vibrio ichthyoenteri ATCC 700023]|uniref:HTH cro/C1-type domain-containing protein n=2 Tax=Vibrio ichthyoenteri TaxID=142461 RepID=F9S7U5_9VIBR|nr:hypothetical protein VII00023_20662 [Vibrio ichthyoenteri ATCC 700023]